MRRSPGILITGGAGFVGSNLAVKFREVFPRKRIIALDNLKRRGSELNVERLKNSGVEFIHGDIRNREDLDEIGKIDFIIECSAEPSVLAGFGGDPRYLIDTNLSGAVNCFELARKRKAGVIFLSTSRVYPQNIINSLSYRETATRFELNKKQRFSGVSNKGISEEFPVDGIRSLYGATKLSAELVLREYIDMYGVKGVINRCGVIAGPWQMGKVDQGFVSLWVASHIFGKRLSYIGYGGKGKQVRDVLHIDDLFGLVRKQMDEMDKISGEVYNVGGGRNLSVSLAELTAICRKVTGNSIEVSAVKKTRSADIPYYVTDFSKVKKHLGWRPRKNLEQIVGDISAWISENRGKLKYIFE